MKKLYVLAIALLGSSAVQAVKVDFCYNVAGSQNISKKLSIKIGQLYTALSFSPSCFVLDDSSNTLQDLVDTVKRKLILRDSIFYSARMVKVEEVGVNNVVIQTLYDLNTTSQQDLAQSLNAFGFNNANQQYKILVYFQ